MRTVYVTDYLRRVTTWPQIYYTGPLTPEIDQKNLYASSTGYMTTMEMKKSADGTDDPNTWCVSDIDQGRFEGFLSEFNGQDKFDLKLSINLESFDKCETDYSKNVVVRFEDAGSVLEFFPGRGHAHPGGGGSDKKKSKTWCYVIVFLILIGAGAGAFYWFKIKNGDGGFSTI